MHSRSRTARWVGTALATVLLATFGVIQQASAVTTTAQSLRVVTFNTDFRGAAYFGTAWDVIRPEADVVFVQEAKNVVLNDVVGPYFVVRQDTSADARQNSAVIIRKSVVSQVGSLELVLGVGAVGGDCGIMARYITKVPIQLTNGRWLRVASLHMPPARCQTGPGGPYDTMADNVVRFANSTDRLTVLGADWNKVVDWDPNNIGGRTGLRPYGPDEGLRIDGFYASPRIGACCLHKLQQIGDNDHRPVVMTTSVPAP